MSLTSEDRFSIDVSPVEGIAGIFYLVLRQGSATVGGAVPGPLGPDFRALANIRLLDNERLDPQRNTPDDLLRLTTDIRSPELYEATRLDLGENFDRWSIRGYQWGERIVILFGQPDRPTTRWLVPVGSYDAELFRAREAWVIARSEG